MKAMRRVQAVLVDPCAEWTLIEQESADPSLLLARYVALLAIIPSVFGFIGACLIGEIAPGRGVVRAPLIDGLFGAVFCYVVTCATVLMLALIITLLAPRFGGRRSFDSAFRLAAYSFTPVWLCGIFLVLPGLHFLLLCGFYGTYILWLGLPRLIKLPEQTSLTFALTIAACACLLVIVAGTAQRVIFGTPGL
jgi:hypothetical protein